MNRSSYLLIALLTVLLAPGARAQDTEVLFLGNSYTARNDLPALVEGLALAGGHGFAQDRNTPGGNTLGAPQSSGQPHRSNATSLAKIAARDWEVVVLQEQSFLPTIAAAKLQYMFTGAASLVDSIETNHASTRTLLYQTWGRRDGGQFCAFGSCASFTDFDAMQDALTAAYAECAAVVGAEIAPVGEAWRRARALDPGVVLHANDGSHPSLAGSYLTACVFYARIFDESPRGLGFTAGLDPALAAFLQDVAARVALFTDTDLGTRHCTPAPNSTGLTGRMTVSGSAVSADDHLVLIAIDLPPAANIGYFVMGAGTNSFTPPGSSGPLCAAPGLLRYLGPVNNTTELGGGFSRLVGTAGPVSSHLIPGSTWSFQAWHRDGGAPSNFTDAVRVTFR